MVDETAEWKAVRLADLLEPSMAEMKAEWLVEKMVVWMAA